MAYEEILSIEDYALCNKLKVMRFSGMSEVLEDLLWDPNSTPIPFTGRTGYGKRYIANALAISALRQFKAVKHRKASYLINELNRAKAMATYQETLAQLVSFDLLVIYAFGLIQLDLNKCRNLFEVLESRDPGKSTMVVCQFPVST